MAEIFLGAPLSLSDSESARSALLSTHAALAQYFSFVVLYSANRRVLMPFLFKAAIPFRNLFDFLIANQRVLIQLLLKYAIAFLNARCAQGTVAFGVEDSGKVIGLRADRKAQDQINTLIDELFLCVVATIRTNGEEEIALF